jgi:hypothetical protein
VREGPSPTLLDLGSPLRVSWRRYFDQEEASMTRVEIIGDKLSLTIEGIDVILSFKKHLEVPLAHVTGVELGITKEAQARLDKSIRIPGAYMPGIAIAGHFYRDGHWVFWNIHKGEKAITIVLDHEKFVNLVVEVEDPTSAVAAIRQAIAAR